MDVVVLPTPADIARAAADRIADIVSQRPDTVLGLATGSSPLPLYQELARRHREEGLSLAQTQAFLLDEYVGLPADRSEEHTSELQSRGHLVCRLLLEKKKESQATHISPSNGENTAIK